MGRPTLPGTLNRAATAFRDRDFEHARDEAATAVSLDPHSLEAHHFLAASLLALGEAAAADRAFHEALTCAPADSNLLLSMCDLLIDRLGTDPDALDEAVELADCGAQIALDVSQRDVAGDFLLLQARALVMLGRAAEAVPRLHDAEELLGGAIEPRLQRGIALFELLRLDEASEVLEQAVAEEADEPLGHWYLGLIHERAGRAKESVRALERARRLDPEEYPPPVLLAADAFVEAVHQAMARLPTTLRTYLSEVPVEVEPFPADEHLLAQTPALSPTVLGLLRGVAPDERARFPAALTLYQRNLERHCRSRAELLQQIEITVLHEVGHFLDIGESELR